MVNFLVINVVFRHKIGERNWNSWTNFSTTNLDMIASRSLSWFSYLQNKEKIYEVKIKVKSKLIRALCSSSTIAAATTQCSFLFIVQKLLGIFVSKSVKIWFRWICTYIFVPSTSFYHIKQINGSYFHIETFVTYFIRKKDL